MNSNSKRGNASKARANSKSMKSAAKQLVLFGQPQFFEGEHASSYRELLARTRVAVNPKDFIDEMFINDVVYLEWEIFRWRRLKSNLIRACGLEALKTFLSETLDEDLYADLLKDKLTEILQDNCPEDQADDWAETLAQAYVENDPDACEKVDKLLSSVDLNIYEIQEEAKADKVEELVQDYARGKRRAVVLIEGLLAEAGKSIDTLLADALTDDHMYPMNKIERIDRLTAVVEARRNAALREIDRRRPATGEALRGTTREIDGAEFGVLNSTAAKGKTA